jgi:ABC-type uncharacterized transport system substrate-binding protein
VRVPGPTSLTSLLFPRGPSRGVAARGRRSPAWRSSLLLALALVAVVAGGCTGRTEPGPAGGPTPARVAIVELAPDPGSEESVAGVLAGMHASGLREGIEYTVRRHSAQGDMTLLPAIIEAAKSEGVDLFVAVSTPVLQALVNRGGGAPTVFTYVGNPVVAGAGKNNEEHLPWVTGVFTMSDFTQAAAVLKECLPNARRVGTLFCPAEVNSVLYRDELEMALAAVGVSVVSVPVNVASDVTDASLALCSERIDAVCQISDNLTSATFAAVITAANRTDKPLFAFQSCQVEAGALVGVSRDFFEAGREAGLVVARVLRGETPDRIPFRPATATKLQVNLEAATRLGTTIPDSVLARASRVVGRPGS